MLYPVYVHKDEGSAYGLTFPDFPGCFSAADKLADLPSMAQEAVEVHFEGEDMEIPLPSTPEQWAADKRFEGGHWMFVEIDLAKIRSTVDWVAQQPNIINRVNEINVGLHA
jgi:predicted RNase H-like HicB family nuclease